MIARQTISSSSIAPPKVQKKEEAWYGIECDDVVTPDAIDLSLYQSREVVPSETRLSEFEELQQKDKIEFIQKTIQQVGTKAEAARRLGIKPTHLQYLLNAK